VRASILEKENIDTCLLQNQRRVSVAKPWTRVLSIGRRLKPRHPPYPCCSTVVCRLGSIADHGLRHSLAPDRVNLDLLVWVGDRLLPRESAGVSPFDSAVQVGTYDHVANIDLRMWLGEGR
jgi:hypothetical protein